MKSSVVFAFLLVVTLVALSTAEKIYPRNDGGSGKPAVYSKMYSSEKEAKEGAKMGGQGTPAKHSPHAGGFNRWHYHSTDSNGVIIKDGFHHAWGKAFDV